VAAHANLGIVLPMSNTAAEHNYKKTPLWGNRER